VSLRRKVKTSLDENRLLILGAQVLFGFQFEAAFQDAFADLTPLARGINCLALVLMAVAIGLLIAPSMQHRIVENGADTKRIHQVAGLFGGAALVPFGISLGLDLFIVVDHLFGRVAGAMVGGGLFVIAALLWFVIGLILRSSLRVPPMSEKEEQTTLATRIEQMLTEARVIVPGAQAMLGFQLAVTFTRTFGEIGTTLQIVHVLALCFVALAVVLLMTPAALHRIAFRGQDTKKFLTLGSGFVLAAPAALAIGVAADMKVAVTQASHAPSVATATAAACFIILLSFWYGLPLLVRWQLNGSRRRV
jgi:hypothetical protein